MKYALIIPDGCADEPQASLGGKTPLQAANTPAMDEIARCGIVGRSNNVPDHLPAGSDVANLSLLGYDVDQYFTGRAPLEAAAQDISSGDKRLGGAMQSGHRRRPDDARLHRRPHFHRRSHAAVVGPATTRADPALAVRSRCQLSKSADLSRCTRRRAPFRCRPRPHRPTI